MLFHGELCFITFICMVWHQTGNPLLHDKTKNKHQTFIDTALFGHYINTYQPVVILICCDKQRAILTKVCPMLL